MNTATIRAVIKHQVDRNAKLIRAKIECSDKPVKSAELEHYFGVAGSIVRDCIRDLRRAGVLIIGDDEGYSIVKTYEEYQHLRNSLRSRCLSMFATIKKMDESALKQFLKSEPQILELTMVGDE